MLSESSPRRAGQRQCLFLYIKNRGDWKECEYYRSICLLSVAGKVCGRIITDHMSVRPEGLAKDKQRDLCSGGEYVDLLFAVRWLMEKGFVRDRRLLHGIY